MLRRSANAVVARNEIWSSGDASEPYECGWAAEAILFLRALDRPPRTGGRARVQISPDGMNWLDEGTKFALPKKAGATAFARVAHFGNWLRVVVDLPKRGKIKVLVTISLKG